MLGWFRASVVDDGPTSAQHWANALCLLGRVALHNKRDEKHLQISNHALDTDKVVGGIFWQRGRFKQAPLFCGQQIYTKKNEYVWEMLGAHFEERIGKPRR